MSRTRSFLENVVILAIVLVLVQTFLEDVATLLGWSVGIRNALLVAGFAFDIFFTIEFVTRSYDAVRHRRFADYIWLDRGWIDLLASVPLLVFNSGPAVLAMVTGGAAVAGMAGVLNVLKVVKAIRIARVLRLLRALKIFKNIKNAESVMAQRHVAVISSTVVTVFVFALLALSIGGTIIDTPSLATAYQERAVEVVEYIDREGLAAPESAAALERFLATNGSILTVERGGEVVYSRYDQAYLDRFIQPSDYGYVSVDELAFYIDLRPVNADQAAANLRYFVIIVAIILAMMFIYSPHFAMTVSDPIHVMRRGMTEPGYSLEVKVPSDYRSDDVYVLGREYNRTFLPMKDRENAAESSEGAATQLSMGDIGDLFS